MATAPVKLYGLAVATELVLNLSKKRCSNLFGYVTAPADLLICV